MIATFPIARVFVTTIFAAMLALALPGRADAQLKQYIGDYQNGYWGDQNRRITFYCVVVEGKFDHQTATKVWQQVTDDADKKHKANALMTHNLTRITYKTGGDFYVISGFVNTNQKQTDWIAMQNTSDTTSRWIRRSGESGKANGWVYTEGNTEGYKIRMGSCDDDAGNIVFTFDKPN
jgi:hypothetical protein